MAIHPRQVEIAQRVFAPSPEEIERALRVIRAHEEAQAAGLGAFALDGKMVDMPVVKAAENIVRKGQQAGLL
jgi:citrate lyase beta subunit